MADQWLSIVEYARYYSLSDMTVRRRIKTGKLRAVLRDGKYYIPMEDGPYENSTFPQAHHPAESFQAPSSWSSPYEDQRPRHHPRSSHGEGNKEHRGGEHYQRHRRHFEKSPQRHYPEVKPRRFLSPKPQTPQATSSASFLPFAGPEPHPGQGSLIPLEIKKSLVQQETIMLESKALLSFCESVLAHLSNSEKRLEGDFQNKVATLEAKTKHLEAQLNAKDFKVNELQQQVEDLQLLVKIIEKQKNG